ncbi:MFS transporter [Nonomuraea sp. NPDC050556]|uniref:MFS transporter n=1 Tax=Nonomuraea sp. NPDC050556 TaxID=3364369 RepID=UPI0037A68607
MRRRSALAVGWIVVLLAALDAYVVVTVLIDIADDLDIPLNHLERATPVVTGFLLGYIAAMPLLGQLSDRYGRRLMIQLCLLAFAVGSALTALAVSLPMVVAGRTLQGVAGGALLPITMALAGDLWDERERPVALGAVGAAQELGSALGPLYGGVVALMPAVSFLGLELGGWHAIFWINLPLTLAVAVAVHFAIPPDGKTRAVEGPTDDGSGPAAGRPVRRPVRVDGVGGALLALALALLVVGFYNPDPANAVLPPWGLPVIAAGVLVGAVFVWWEIRSPVRLLDLTGTRKGPLLTTLAVSFLTGAALLVTMVFVQFAAQTLLDLEPLPASLLLARFLIALPIGAVLGGWLARRLGDAVVTAGGLAVAAVGYFLMSRWPLDLAAAGLIVDLDLVVAGLGLGVVIAPIAAAVLRVTTPGQHGVASAAVVVSRMMGMLIGIAGVSAWGFARFQSLTRHLDTPMPFGVDPPVYAGQLAEYAAKVKAALHVEYTEMFLVTAVLCVAGAVLAAFMPRSADAALAPRSAGAVEDRA